MVNYRNPFVQEDLAAICGADLDWQRLTGRTVLITGASGMIASYLAFAMMFLNERYDLGITLMLLARNRSRLETVFGKEDDKVKFLVQDVCDEINPGGKIDYIFHAAGDASPYHIRNDPVGIVRANVIGTMNVLNAARDSGTQTVLFTSTREVYGKVENKEIIEESDLGTLDPLDPRSCYPESKRIAETLLTSFSTQYGVVFKSLRIAHTYGPGMRLDNDGRVMADFLNDAVHGRNIHLNSAGLVERSFCYISDCVDAIFRVALNGKDNQAYNIANEAEPISVRALASLIQRLSGNNKGVEVRIDEALGKAYCNYRTVKLGLSKIKELGWRPMVSLESGITKTLASYNNANAGAI